MLTEAGLRPALETLADSAPLPVELAHIQDRRYPPTVEAAAYFAVAETIDGASRRGADHVDVFVAQHDGRLVLTVRDNGRPTNAPIVALIDRLGALGGNISITPTETRMEIPCA